MAEQLGPQFGELGGIEYRIKEGKKAPDDLVIELRARDWVPVKMSLSALLTVFLCQNEDRLYKPSEGYKGERKYTEFIHKCIISGWEKAVDDLEEERRRRRERDTGDS